LTVRHESLQRAQRMFLFFVLAMVAIVAFVAARTAGFGFDDVAALAPPGSLGPAWGRQLALISGHAGNDSGATCEDAAGQVLLTEADVNARVVELAAGQLRRAGAEVVVLDEYDPRLEAMQADVLLSVHADSCIDASGYKAASFARTLYPATAERLLTCIDTHYPAVTGLPHHPNTVTHDMTEYHAFRRIDPQTPAAIIELGFLGGDQQLLTDDPGRVARGVVDSITCFLATLEPTDG
jgi:N-acetylmuramoyl-L-alanine amidase